jgi:hypothetical protein
MTHQEKDCVERPRSAKKAAWKSGLDIAPDEVTLSLEAHGKISYSTKRDQWKGYDPTVYQEVIEKHQRIELEKRKLKRELKEQRKKEEEENKRKNKKEERLSKRKDKKSSQSKGQGSSSKGVVQGGGEDLDDEKEKTTASDGISDNSDSDSDSDSDFG